MEHHDHEHGLARDIQTMLDMTLSRRQSLRWMFASAAALPLAACGGGGDAGGTSVGATPAAGTTPAAGGSASCAVIPKKPAARIRPTAPTAAWAGWPMR